MQGANCYCEKAVLKDMQSRTLKYLAAKGVSEAYAFSCIQNTAKHYGGPV